MKMRIAMLYTTAIGGGAAVAAEKQKTWLQRNGHLVDCYHLRNLEKKTSLLFYINRLLDLIITKLFFRGNPILHSSNLIAQKLSGKLNNKDYDLVLVHWFSNGLISFEDFERIEAPIVIVCHDSWLVSGFEHHPHNGKFSNSVFDKFLIKKKAKLLYRCNYLIFPSKWQRDLSIARFPWLSSKSVVIPNIIGAQLSPENLPLSCCTDSPSGGRGSITISCIASKIFQNTQKGGDLLKDVLQILDSQLADSPIRVEFRIIGKESDPSALPALNCIDLVQTGQIPNEVVQQELLYSDIFVNLSTLENFSNANIEAQFAGCLVLCRDVGGNRETFACNESGILIPEDPMEISCALLDLFLNIRSVRHHREFRRKVAHDRFCADVIGPRYIELFNNVLKS